MIVSEDLEYSVERIYDRPLEEGRDDIQYVQAQALVAILANLEGIDGNLDSIAESLKSLDMIAEFANKFWAEGKMNH